MKRVLIVFGVCIGAIVLTNCQDTGGRMDPFTQRLMDNQHAWLEDMSHNMETQAIEDRIRTLERQMKQAEDQIDHLLQRIVILETANLDRAR